MVLSVGVSTIKRWTQTQCPAWVQVSLQFYGTGLNVKRLQQRKQMCGWAAHSVASSDRWETRCMNVNDFPFGCTSELQSQKLHQYWMNAICCGSLHSLKFTDILNTFVGRKIPSNQSMSLDKKLKTDRLIAALMLFLTAVMYFICPTCVSAALSILVIWADAWDQQGPFCTLNMHLIISQRCCIHTPTSFLVSLILQDFCSLLNCAVLNVICKKGLDLILT